MPDAAFRFLLQSFQATRQRGFCRGVHPIDEQNSVEMIVLMLDRAREKTTLIDFLNRFTFGPQDRVTILQDRQDHGPSGRVNAGKFFTPASFNASITLMIVPNDAFLSACSASVDLRCSGKLRTAASSSSTFM